MTYSLPFLTSLYSLPAQSPFSPHTRSSFHLTTHTQVLLLLVLGVSSWLILYSPFLWSPATPVPPSSPASAQVSCIDLPFNVPHSVSLLTNHHLASLSYSRGSY